jgi:hypothetical protein
VVLLKESVLNSRKFMQANPHYVLGKPCVYVGVTYLSAQERFEQHMKGVHSARIVRKFGDQLIQAECRLTKPISRAHALKREARRTAELRELGWAVWSK